MRTYGDESFGDTVSGLSASLVEADFFLGGTVDGQTAVLAALAHASGKAMVAGAGGSPQLFQGYPTVFGTFGEYNRYFASSLRLLSALGARTVGVVYENQPIGQGLCAGVTSHAVANGLTVVDWSMVRAQGLSGHALEAFSSEFGARWPAAHASEQLRGSVPATMDFPVLMSYHASRLQVAENPGETDVATVVTNMKALAPDVVLGCLAPTGCTSWVRQLKTQDFTPKATVLPYCVTRLDAVAKLGEDSRYLMGATAWDASIGEADALVGWDSAEFGARFEQYLGLPPHQYAASAAASIGVLVQAIERAASTSSSDVAAQLRQGAFQTLFGRVSFDQVSCWVQMDPDPTD